ncbi:universal stress protein [Nonomuraea sp. KC401]|uniref:Universal stress protein n=1 Tax=Nonomuraea longispora TaxID=1848320 RepID=A0A4R4NNX4_9ACTN|nr:MULTISPECIES: universal stress protein [Nonomuraea]NBE93290.1 universal stress protein [Nonomuraea sp. K271]TDC10514.1 universal stress protein [Nonomuraea longispora]TLF59007.1 universal stress protein [Nonomuraea sp. KC401]
MIIVGVDGSRAGLEAAGWAAREAALRRARLTVAHAVPRWVCDELSARYAEVARWMRDEANSVLTAARDRALRERPAIVVETTLLPGDPRTALIKAAEQAELLIVGSHGIGGVRGLLVGSVAHGVAAHARTNVVVVGERPATPSRGEIVAGFDGSPPSLRALDFALAAAGLREARLRVVQAWAWPRPGGFPPADPDTEQHTLQQLKDQLAERQERHPDIDLVPELVHGHPVEVLKEAAEGADLLVVGSRGHGQLAGMLLGSISQALLHHSPCPLAVVRA